MLPATASAFVVFPIPPFVLAVFKSPSSAQLEPLQTSVADNLGVPGGFCPPIHNADVEGPAFPQPDLAAFKSATSVHDDPFHDSLIALYQGGIYPPKAKHASLSAPVTAKPNLAVLRSPTSVQLEPFHCSVYACTVV